MDNESVVIAELHLSNDENSNPLLSVIPVTPIASDEAKNELEFREKLAKRMLPSYLGDVETLLDLDAKTEREIRSALTKIYLFFILVFLPDMNFGICI